MRFGRPRAGPIDGVDPDRPDPTAPGGGARRKLRVGTVLAVAGVLLVAAGCVRLGFWQLGRLEERRERNAALTEAMSLPPLELDATAVAVLLRHPQSLQFRRVRVRGEYVPGAEVILRGRSFQGQPGVYLLTPLRLEDSRWSVVVNRGWAGSPDALTLDPRPLAESGVRVVEGLLELFPSDVPQQKPLEREVAGYRVSSIHRLAPEPLQQRLASPLLPTAYVHQLPGDDAPAGLQRLPLPEVDEGPHLGYAFQWFSFAAIAVVGLLVLLLRSRRGAV